MFFPRRDRGTNACAYHEGWNETEARVKQSLRIASRASFAQSSDDWEEQHFRFVLITFKVGTDRGHDDHDCKCKVLKMPESCKTVSLAERARSGSLVVGGNSGSRAVVFPILRVGLLEGRPVLSGEREKTQRERIAMSSGGRHSRRAGSEDHESSVSLQFGTRR